MLLSCVNFAVWVILVSVLSMRQTRDAPANRRCGAGHLIGGIDKQYVMCV